MKENEKKYHNYSLSFYQKENDLREVSNRAKLGFDNFQRHEKILKPRTIELFLNFANQNKEEQKECLKEDSQAHIEALLDIVKALNSNRQLMEFVLPTLDAIFSEESKVLREVVNNIKETRNISIITQLKSILAVESHQPASYQAATRIVCMILGELPKQSFGNEQKNFLLEIMNVKKEARKPKLSDFGIESALVHLNKHEALSTVFLENGGPELVIENLKKAGNEIQLLYYTLLNIWLLSFNTLAVEKFIGVPRYGLIRLICELLQKLSRQKLTRVSFMIFKNLQENHSCLELMMDGKLLKIIDTLLKGNIKDEELIEMIKDIGSVLESNIRVLSSFDKYVREITNENMEWSSVHTERFWKENAVKFQNNDFQMIKKLRYMLGARNPQNVAIACYDLGEFSRFYPHGRNVIQNLQIKEMIMEKARYSEDKNVREQALLALQKLMIQNWQNL